MTRILSLLAALMLGSAASAHQITVGTLEIVHPNIPTPFAGAKSAAGYMALVNNGADPDRLISATAGFADMTMLHESKTDANGVATMSHVAGLDIPAGETVTLEPGGYHIMFMGLKQTPVEGEMLPVTLTFERAGTVEVEFMVDPPGEGGHDHEQHGAAGDHSHHGPMSTVGMTDPEAITTMLKAQFETPDSPLTVEPITVQGEVAVAGWSQDGRGGRAFLRKDAEGWFVELCAGKDLVTPGMLQSLGLTAAEADGMAEAIATAEAAGGPDLVARLDGFEGTVIVGRGAAHAHGG